MEYNNDQIEPPPPKNSRGWGHASNPFLFPSNNSFFMTQNKGFKATIFNHHLHYEKDHQTVVDGSGEGAVRRDGKTRDFAEGK